MKTLLLTVFLLPGLAMAFSKARPKNDGPPHPFDLNPAAYDQVKRLWPNDLKGMKKVDVEKVKQQWLNFAREYPDNMMVPWEAMEMERPSSQNSLMMDLNPDELNRRSQMELVEKIHRTHFSVRLALLVILPL